MERRRMALHPARAVPELVATAPGRVYTWDITIAGRVQGKQFDFGLDATEGPTSHQGRTKKCRLRGRIRARILT